MKVPLEMVTYYCPCCDRDCKVITDSQDTKPFKCPYNVDRCNWKVESKEPKTDFYGNTVWVEEEKDIV